MNSRDLPPRKFAGPLQGAGAICIGNCSFADAELAAIGHRDGMDAAWMAAFARFGAAAPAHATGEFAVAVRDEAGRILLAVDRFSTHPLCFRVEGTQLHFGEHAGDVSARSATIAPQAVFDYLYFHVIPAPRTIFTDTRRLPAGNYALFENGSIAVAPWWNPVFEETRRVPFGKLRDNFLQLIEDSVAAQIRDRRVGCFLSGGTDSSTVAGMLGRVTGKPPATFSIGFEAEGYDEMEYARVAAKHFHADHHEYYVTPDDLVESIPMIAAAYDQPFGNSSVAPAYYCARMAKEAGIEHILAGDGGDELFGGNTRYAWQRVFSFYEAIPERLRTSLLEPSLLGWPMLARMPVIRKAVSYVDQARVPLPDRLQRYNLLTRIGLAEVLSPAFLASVDPEAPLRQQRDVFRACAAPSMINRLLAYDWKYTLADNDIPKVVGAVSLAGISVGFPFLDDRLVDFSLGLEPSLKLKGLKLRWFFKEALRGFLPDATLAKKKHGFGLPFGIWLNRHAGLQELAYDSLSSLGTRGYVRPEFLDKLRNEYLSKHAAYYGELVWILVMFEQWLRAGNARSNAEAIAPGRIA